MENEGREGNETREYTGNKDRGEKEYFKKTLQHPFGHMELEQEGQTHENDSATSRLDRVYANFHIADQLDRRVECSIVPCET